MICVIFTKADMLKQTTLVVDEPDVTLVEDVDVVVSCVVVVVKVVLVVDVAVLSAVARLVTAGI